MSINSGPSEMSNSEVEEELISSTVEFTGSSRDRARKLLEESNWNVPEAVTRHYLEAESPAAHAHSRQPRQQTMSQQGQPDQDSADQIMHSQGQAQAGALKAFMLAIKSCLGWAGSSCWTVLKWFLFGSSVQNGSGCLSNYFNGLSEGIPRPICREETFQQAATRSRTRDNRKVLIVYLDSASSERFHARSQSVICSESVSSIINEQFIFWSGDVDFSAPLGLWRALPIRSIPILAAIVSVNSTELKIVAACSSTQFNEEDAIAVLHKAQEAQDRLFAEDEQFRINRSLRESQDREFEESLERDRQLEEARQAEREKDEQMKREIKEQQQSKLVRKSVIQREKELALARVEKAKQVVSATTIVVKLPGGVRIEKKFDKTEAVATLYDWVLCSGLLHSHASEAGKAIRAGAFSLSTTFPARRLENMDATLEELDLVPNAVLAFARLDDDSDIDSIDVTK